METTSIKPNLGALLSVITLFATLLLVITNEASGSTTNKEKSFNPIKLVSNKVDKWPKKIDTFLDGNNVPGKTSMLHHCNDIGVAFLCK